MADTPKTDTPEYEYDVCFSFAYEDQPYVETVVKKLELMGINVFYAPFKEADLWGRNLHDYFSDIYSKKSRYCVIFISEHYSDSVWTTLERKEAQARAFQESEPYILPARFDKTEIPGIPKTVAYISLVDKTPEEFAGVIQDRVRKEKPPSEQTQQKPQLEERTRSPEPINKPDEKKIEPKPKNKLTALGLGTLVLVLLALLLSNSDLISEVKNPFNTGPTREQPPTPPTPVIDDKCKTENPPINCLWK